MCPYWLEVAVEHLDAASLARQELLGARQSNVEQEAGSALEREFSAGMQALTSAATALDALYASVRDRITIPEPLVARWRANRTARPHQVLEAFRRAFRVKGRGLATLGEIVTQLYRLRDLAVHPAAEFTDPIPHPILESATEWRFISFGFDSARAGVRGVLAVATQLAGIPRAKESPLVEYCADLNRRVQPLGDRWAAQFGPLVHDRGAT